MTTAIIITFCTLLLISYFFDLTSSRTKIPSVILLLALGWFVRQSTNFFGIELPDFSPILPIIGSIGLILIVLEGSLELDLNRSKISLIKKSFFGAIIPLLGLAFLFTYLFHHFGYFPIKDSLLNAIPLCIISSAIAIPSVRNLKAEHKEFVIYESSISDIFGVIFFNFIFFNRYINIQSFGNFGLELLVEIVISLIATVVLAFLLSKIKTKIKFVPIILLVILIYEISKIYHLPALIFILMFGLSIGNIEKAKKYKWMERFRLDILIKEVKKFKELTIEATFLIRSLFFLVFGYLIEIREVINLDSLKWAAVIVGIIFIFRLVQLLISKLPLIPLLFVSPRGLITILLFLAITPSNQILLVNRSLIIQVILLSSLIMMFGLMITKKHIKKLDKKEKGEKDLTIEN